MTRLLFASLFSLSVSSTAHAITIDSSTCALGGPSCTVNGATVNASGDAGANLTNVTFRGNDAIGVGPASNDQRDLELQGGADGGESLTVDFTTPQFVDSILLAAFYNPEEFGGDPEEIARIEGTGAFGTALLEITNFGNQSNELTSNDPNLFGDLTRTSTEDGTVSITDLFTSLGPVTQLVFTAANTPKGSDNSDYAVASIQTSPVPLPAGALLLPAAIAGLGFVRRARR
jgi:hypothetical protein